MQQRRSLPPVQIWALLVVSISATFLLMAMFPAFRSSAVFAAPGQTSADQVLNQNVGYLGPEAAASLNLDFPVLVPSDVPAPFGGEPTVSAGGSSYSLYWMNAGGDPTFLQVSGTVGGALPAGSPADLNNELTINASVGGNEAISDVTDAYDAVWWISGGVLYSVESRNMGMASLDLANSLVLYAGPETQTPVEELPPDAGGGILETPTDGPDLPDEGTDSSMDGEAEPSEATEEADVPVETAAQPTAQGDQPEAGPTMEPTADPAELLPGETAEPTAEPTAETQAELNPEPTDEPEPTAETQEELTPETSTAAGTVGSDGTGGAPVPVFGGDGTGGTRDLIIPERDE